MRERLVDSQLWMCACRSRNVRMRWAAIGAAIAAAGMPSSDPLPASLALYRTIHLSVAGLLKTDALYAILLLCRL